MFFNGGIFVIDVFSHAIMDEACGATNVLLAAVVTRELVYWGQCYKGFTLVFYKSSHCLPC